MLDAIQLLILGLLGLAIGFVGGIWSALSLA
jgi:hypothetical protein